MESYAAAVEHIVHYLMVTKDKEIIPDPDAKQFFSVYVNADFSRNWFNKAVRYDASAAKSRTEAEYAAFITEAREAIMCSRTSKSTKDEA
eukprot:11182635-Ditylum_brightwellii.AAC.1